MVRRIDIAKAEGRIVDQGKVENVHERVDVLLFKAADTHQFTNTETEGVNADFDYVGGRKGIEGKQKTHGLCERRVPGTIHH
ncbi:hypothetical protein RV134_210247 [Roseovarius sp. EC-HK134]|nr:hypothetical protein RV134_210247 [Roseovarius sp. EC-HK134]VVT02141.1 hypothetical protein RV420_260113 [Roseovarius sp. EC-SD190]